MLVPTCSRAGWDPGWRPQYWLMEPTAKPGWIITGEGVPNTLPRPLTSFVGRSTELSRLKSLLLHSRMVTLTGPGGSGKSRLAAELGRAGLGLWPWAVWWVDLSPVQDPRLVAGAVVSALELRGQGTAQDVAIAWLTTRRALLILDNCEHLLGACAGFSQVALERCPELTVIATSREPLGVPGEAHWPVSSMRAPDAVRLFAARAALVQPDFNVGARNADLVAQICERIDHLPLAIELAAARMGVMTEQDILSQLTDRFQLLAGGHRTAPERQRTMSAAIDWSYRLLTKSEALLFCRLSVFRGGFDFEGVRAICAHGIAGHMLDALAGLVQKSMVVAERTDNAGTRYRLLESHLAYAEDRLREAGESESTQRLHYEYFLQGVVARTRNPDRAQPPPGLVESQWIARESGNLWAAMWWARDNVQDMGLNLAAHMAFVTFGDIGQARSLLADLLDRSPEKGVPRIYALRSATALAMWQGDSKSAVGAAEAALILARDQRDPELLAYALTVAAVAHEMHDAVGIASDMYQEASSLLRGSSNRLLVTQITINSAWLAVERGDYVEARDRLVESNATAKAAGDLLLAASGVDALAWAHLGLGDVRQAHECFKEALAISRNFRDYPELLSCLNGLVSAAGAGGNDLRALRLAAGAGRLSGERLIRSDLWPERQAEEALVHSRDRLGKGRSDIAWKEGWAMSTDRLIDYALGENDAETQDNAGPLSRRERDVAKLVAAGMTNRQIGERLFISSRTVDGHVERIRNRLGVRSRTEVATWALEHGLSSDRTASEPIMSRKRGSPQQAPSKQQR
jgi:predicted ATPase/DNA-binding CsgD family transcriptional regulator